MGHKKVSAIRILVLDPQGRIAWDDDQEKTVGIFYGRTTEKKLREVVCDFVEVMLMYKQPGLKIPLRNVVTRSPEDIDRIFGKFRPDLKALV